MPIADFGARAACRSTTRSTPRRTIPTSADPRFACDLAFLGNRLPDREARVEGFFLEAAGCCPSARFLIGGNGWDDKAMPANVRAARPRLHAASTTPSTRRRSRC